MIAITLFVGFVSFLFWLSWFLGKKSNSADGFFVAGGQINWFVNGIALTGGYLSAASFLGICGMIAFKGFDGYLYSIGFLSGWVVALFVVAEPLRRLGKYTMADALESRFKSRAIHLAAGISTLIICMCYLVPQMVGAGVLIEPLLGISHQWGVILVGSVVIVIVASAGMSSTTYVQFIKAGMLITFSGILVVAVLLRGLTLTPSHYAFRSFSIETSKSWDVNLKGTPFTYIDTINTLKTNEDQSVQDWILLKELVPINKNKTSNLYEIFRHGQRVFEFDSLNDQKAKRINVINQEGKFYMPIDVWWQIESQPDGKATLHEVQYISELINGDSFINGLPSSRENVLLPMGRISKFGSRNEINGKTGPIGPLKFLSIFSDPETELEVPRKVSFKYGNKDVVLHYHEPVPGNEFMRPGGHFKIHSNSPWGRIDFISLMIALFFGTAALPHVLIRYYTVKDSNAARKSTIVAISAIGIFYIMTLFLGLGAISNGVLNPLTENMSAPLLAYSFGEIIFAIISALAFATVLGTVSGLIVAASGAVANDLMDKYFNIKMNGKQKVRAAKITAVLIGIIAVFLGIIFQGVNVGFLVGLAFAVAASANFPSIIMVLFWKRTTAAGIVSSIFVGAIISLGIIIMGPDMFVIYGLNRADAWLPFGQPAIVAMPISFLTLIFVSLLTKPNQENF
ncbi:MAG: hypothetical protein A2Y40_05905 [Candidatus Margulisbacteria bacterium GWF2_35_9]|nr:MAG: hypothetical protein A2Y40_05905 [Candidatus Margulisbacteria bacterium GWF2_35_9]